MLSHIYQVLFRSGCSFSTFGVFLFLFLFFLLEDEDPQNVRSWRRGEEKWLYSHGKTLVKFIQIHWQMEILHISCRFIELSPSDFYFRWGFVENRKAGSNSLTNTMTFFFLYVSGSGRDSHFEMFSGPDFEESYPNIWSLLPAPAKSILFFGYVTWGYIITQINFDMFVIP